MKKRNILLATLIVLLVVVTGGVYATWTYATKAAEDSSVGGNDISIEEAKTTNRGVISTEGSTFSIAFDDVNYNHKLDLEEDGEIVITGEPVEITFTVNDGSTVDTGKESYNLNFQITSTLTNLDDDAVITSNPVSIALTQTEDDKTYSLSLTNELVKSLIASVDLSLPTAEKHKSFEEKLSDASFTIVITDDASQE